MSEQKKSFNNFRTILFVIVICFVCAFVLSLLSSYLKKPQEEAKQLYQNKQLLISAKIVSPQDTFQIYHQGKKIPAVFDEATELLKPSKVAEKAKRSDVLSLYRNRVEAKLVDSNGNIYSFSDLQIDPIKYIEDNQKRGFSDLKYKLLYVIKPNDETEESIYGYVIPINGFGLWDAIYGYLCLGPDADTVIGTTWYDQKETPGLGGDIGTYEWQKQFAGKKIFQESTDGQTNFLRTPLGLQVVKSTVEQVYGNSPKAKSAIDGIAGATITITGVTEAYRSSLSPYRAFLIKAHNNYRGQ